jgi:hypothetical protein
MFIALLWCAVRCRAAQLLFAIGCVLLKFKRGVLKRDVRAKWYHLLGGMLLVVWGLIGNILKSPRVLAYFVSARVSSCFVCGCVGLSFCVCLLCFLCVRECLFLSVLAVCVFGRLVRVRVLWLTGCSLRVWNPVVTSLLAR